MRMNIQFGIKRYEKINGRLGSRSARVLCQTKVAVYCFQAATLRFCL